MQDAYLFFYTKLVEGSTGISSNFLAAISATSLATSYISIFLSHWRVSARSRRLVHRPRSYIEYTRGHRKAPISI